MSNKDPQEAYKKIPLFYRMIDGVAPILFPVLNFFDKGKKEQSIDVTFENGKPRHFASQKELLQAVKEGTLSLDEQRQIKELLQGAKAITSETTFLTEAIGLGFHGKRNEDVITYESDPATSVQNIRLRIQEELHKKGIEYTSQEIALRFVSQRTAYSDAKAILIISHDLLAREGVKEAIQEISPLLKSSYMFHPDASKMD